MSYLVTFVCDGCGKRAEASDDWSPERLPPVGWYRVETWVPTTLGNDERFSVRRLACSAKCLQAAAEARLDELV